MDGAAYLRFDGAPAAGVAGGPEHLLQRRSVHGMRNAHGKVIPPQFRPVVWNPNMGVPAEQVEETQECLLKVRPVTGDRKTSNT